MPLACTATRISGEKEIQPELIPSSFFPLWWFGENPTLISTSKNTPS
jgi:hypothetical protein